MEALSEVSPNSPTNYPSSYRKTITETLLYDLTIHLFRNNVASDHPKVHPIPYLNAIISAEWKTLDSLQFASHQKINPFFSRLWYVLSAGGKRNKPPRPPVYILV